MWQTKLPFVGKKDVSQGWVLVNRYQNPQAAGEGIPPSELVAYLLRLEGCTASANPRRGHLVEMKHLSPNIPSSASHSSYPLCDMWVCEGAGPQCSTVHFTHWTNLLLTAIVGLKCLSGTSLQDRQPSPSIAMVCLHDATSTLTTCDPNTSGSTQSP